MQHLTSLHVLRMAAILYNMILPLLAEQHFSVDCYLQVGTKVTTAGGAFVSCTSNVLVHIFALHPRTSTALETAQANWPIDNETNIRYRLGISI